MKYNISNFIMRSEKFKYDTELCNIPKKCIVKLFQKLQV